MRRFVVALSAICLAGPLPHAPAHAQQQWPYVQVPVPGVAPPRDEHRDWREDREHRERCEGLWGREHELRERVEHNPQNWERVRWEQELYQVRDDLRDHCERR